MGWLIGALRLMPHFDLVIGGYTLIPNPFWGGVLFPAVVFGFLYAWPAVERRLERDGAQHNLLDRPRDNPRRTAIGAALFAWVATIFFAGAADRAFVQLAVPYEGQLWGYRAASIAVPVATYLITRRVCERLREGEAHPGRGSGARSLARNREGGFEEVRPAPGPDVADPDRA
jgi:ubiquinol-cytochrome c reductase cytochrome b subunit